MIPRWRSISTTAVWDAFNSTSCMALLKHEYCLTFDFRLLYEDGFTFVKPSSHPRAGSIFAACKADASSRRRTDCPSWIREDDDDRNCGTSGDFGRKSLPVFPRQGDDRPSAIRTT